MPKTPKKQKMSLADAQQHVNDLTTSSNKLAEVASHHDNNPEIMQAVSAHPNAGPQALHTAFMSNMADQALEHPNVSPKTVDTAYEQLVAPHDPEDLEYEHKDIVLHPKLSQDKKDALVMKIMGSKGRGIWSDSIASGYFEGGHASDGMVQHAINHPDVKYAKSALKSPNISDDHVKAVSSRKDFTYDDARDILDNQNLSAESIAHLYSKFKGKGKDVYWGSQIEREVVAHPNTPPEIIRKLASKKGSWRKEAMQHHSFPMNELGKLVLEGDEDATGAAVSRSDTSEDILRELNGQVGEVNHKWGIGSNLIQHPNYPEDLQLERAKGTTDEARSLLRRKDLSRNVMDALVSHKNTKLAVDALKHKSITPESVLLAYNRKAKDVAGAAGAHPMLPKELKVNRAAENEEAAKRLVNSDDKDVLRTVAESWGNNRDIRDKLLSNSNLDGDTLHRLVQRHIEEEGSYLPNRLDDNPNMRPETRMMLVKHPRMSHRGFQNDSLTPGEAREGLQHWAQEDRENAGDHATQLLSHPNIDKNLAKEIVTGTYGKLNNRNLSSNELSDFVKKHPLVYTKDVVNAALDTPHELTSKMAVGQIASSADALSGKDIADRIDKIGRMKHGGDRDKQDFYEHISEELMSNPNADPQYLASVVDKALHSSQSTDHKNRLVAAAIQNPSYPQSHIDEIISHPHFPNNTNIRDALVDHIKDNSHEDWAKNLRDKSLSESNHPQYVADLISTRHGDMEDSSLVAKALLNPHPDVVKEVIGKLDANHQKISAANGPWASEVRNYIDKLADHPDQSVRSAAFPMMSPEAQSKMTQGMDIMSSPEMLANISKEGAEKIQIQPHHSIDSVMSLLKNKWARWEHFSQAVDHSENGANAAYGTLHSKFEGNPKGSDNEAVGHIHEKILDKYPESSAASLIANSSNNSIVLDKISSDPRLMNSIGDRLIGNDKVQGRHLDQFMKLRGPGHTRLMSDLVAHPKSSAKLLEHIAVNYPDLMYSVAGHPKAYTSKVLRSIISSGDKHAMARVANNDKTPDDVRDQLKRDPEIVTKMSPDHVEPADLSKFISGADGDRLHAIVAHRSADSKVLEQAFDEMSSSNRVGDEDKGHILDSIVRKPLLDSSLVNKIIDYPGLTTSDAMALSDSNQLSSGQLSNIIQRYGNDDLLLSSLADNQFGHRDIKEDDLPGMRKVAGDIVDRVDFNGSHEDLGGSYPNVSIIRKMMGSVGEKLGDEFKSKVLDKLESSRGEGYSEKDFERTKKSEEEGKLLTHIASGASPKMQDRLVKYPELHITMLQDGVSKPVYDQMISSIPRLHNIIESLDDHYLSRSADEYVRQLVESPNASPESISKIYKYADNYMQGSAKDDVLSSVASSDKTDPKLIQELYDKGNTWVVRNPNMPRSVIDKELGKITIDTAKELAQNPNVSVSDLLDGISKARSNQGSPMRPETFVDAWDEVFGRDKIESVELEKLYNSVKDDSGKGGPAGRIIKNIIKRPEVTESMFNDAYGKGHITKAEAYTNPRWGGRMFRAMDHKIPSGIPNLSVKTPVTNRQELKPRMEKLQSVASMVPADGFIEWANFKKDQPSLAGDPIVQRMFTTAPKQRLTKEHADKYISEVPGKEFHMSYDKWTGMQRHRSVPQLVVQANNGSFMDDVFAKDPAAHRLYSFIQQASKNSGHPTNPQSIGWARVDTADKDHWFIDELQSDFGASVSRDLAKIKDSPEHAAQFAKRVGIPVDQSQKMLSKMIDMMQGWEKALVEHTIDLAKRNGVKKISMHSGKSKTVTNKGDNTEVTNKYDKLYNKMPQDMGFKGDFYRNLPMATEKGLMEHPVWTLDIPQDTKKSEKIDPDLVRKASLVISSLKKEEVKKFSPEAFQAALEAVQALVQVLKDAGYTSPGHEDDKKETPPAAMPQSPHQHVDKPLTHKRHETYAPGAVRQYSDHEERVKQPDGSWSHQSRQGDE